MSTQPTFKNLPQKNLIGLGAKFISIMSPDKNNHTVIPQLWHDYVQHQDEIKDRNTELSYGLISALAPGQEKPNYPEMFYMACAEAPDASPVPTGMVARTVPAGNYAVFTHHGPIAKFEETMKYIFQTWLPASGKKVRRAPELEIYDHRFNPTSETSEMEICIPIE